MGLVRLTRLPVLLSVIVHVPGLPVAHRLPVDASECGYHPLSLEYQVSIFPLAIVIPGAVVNCPVNSVPSMSNL